ncbi:hypothetical protein Tco_1229177 [Tanacetum coccineum]
MLVVLQLYIFMREFKECVEDIEVSDVKKTSLHFTWNQKSKWEYRVLKKIDCVMVNLDFHDVFVGVNVVFQPYRILDHLPAIVRIPRQSPLRTKPFKFSNLQLKASKKLLRKLLRDKGNLHEKVKRLRIELDEVRSALDQDPSNVTLREDEKAYLQAFNEAFLDEEHFLK